MIEKVVDQHHVKMLKETPGKMVHTRSTDRTSGRRLAFYHPGIGSAIAAATLEEAIGFGCRKFIACGGCGVLAPDIAVGQLVVLSGAIRDEGASYHYLPPAREVIANPLGVYTLVDMLKNHGIPHLVGKTWTTDGVYRETPNRIATRRSEVAWWWKWKLLA